ncbi:SgcJ/EcaC family oxidoreductase [Cryptosporangium sp. NPDC051539]|uniref:SgcJ/EcaC family oxidoreductase n=1 Tax=Cryptosporangium sp. NPDC051539 TaxID=3363962 RepID=UPI0037B0811B
MHDDEKAVRQLFESVHTAWNNADAEAFGDAFTEDADYVIFVGTHYRGRPTITQVHDVLWKKYLKGTRLVGHIVDLRFVTDDVAVLTSVGKIAKGRRGGGKPDKVQTFVAVKRDGRWRFTAFQNTKRRPLLEWISTRSDSRLAPNSTAPHAPADAAARAE